MKKIVVILLVLTMFAIPSVAFADTSLEENVVLHHTKDYVEKLKTLDIDGLTTTLFDVRLGNPIPVYQYENGIVVESDVRKYPVFSGNDIVAFVTAYTNSNGNLATQFSFSLVEEVKDYLAVNSEIAFISDDYAVYATNGSEIEKLDDCPTVSGNQFQAANHLDYNVMALNDSIGRNIQTIEVLPKIVVQTKGYGATAIDDSDECPVEFISQNNADNPNTNICWAACLACVGNYLTGEESYDAFSLADDYYGTTGKYNQALHINLFPGIFRSLYDIDYYQSYATCPNFTFLQACIASDMPFIVRATNSTLDTGWGHFIVAYGWWQTIDSGVSRYVLYMDPDSKAEFTMGSVDINGDFEYVTDSNRECWISHSFRGNPYA